MAFQTPITIHEALEAIRRQDYVLPAIQREFTWDTDRICGLFDSLMQGYPIGSFLFWRVEASSLVEYKWYGLLKDYHEKIKRHCPVLDVPQKNLHAILDGQQRLTSLNIGLRGSHAEKEPRRHWENPGAFPKKYLYLNLLALAPENEAGLKYDFRFLTPQHAAVRADRIHWYKVSEVYDFKEDYTVIETLQNIELGNCGDASRTLHRLYTIVHKEGVLPYFEETEQKLDKVLNIFIRLNSAGVPLTYSDLLLSIATAQWSELDARKEIYDLVDELNGTKGGFDFSKDLVLKASLMLSGLPSVAFRVHNFTAGNMKILADNWQGIKEALRITASILTDYGFSRSSLGAHSVVIPLAYYIYKNQLTDAFRLTGRFSTERELLHSWVCRSLIKSGVWGSGLDTLLLAIRSVMNGQESTEFPSKAIDLAMGKYGKALYFTEEELQDLVDSSYGDKRVFPLLSQLFPFIDLTNYFHIDHIFPKSLFTTAKLRKAGMAEDVIPSLQEKCNGLGNLQLLQGTANEEKMATLPSEWLAKYLPDVTARDVYCERHLLGSVPESLYGFEEFYEARRASLYRRLKAIMGATKSG